MTDRRSASRQKAFLQGRIFFNNRRTSIDCLIRDISERGARLKFSSAVATPDVVDLYVPTRGETHRARIEWRVGEEVGVSFGAGEAAPPLAPAAASVDWAARVHKLEHDVAVLLRKVNVLAGAVRKIQRADL
jgi:hypothetical protein